MAQTYTVQYANKLDGQDQYGNVTYSVQFQGEQGSCLVRVRGDRAVEPGQQMYGRIESLTSKTGKPYKKFTREQQVELPTQKPYAKESAGDGAKQGMSINNAAAYVTAHSSNLMTPQEFAQSVEEYARELYKIDVTKEPVLDGSPVDLSEIPDF